MMFSETIDWSVILNRTVVLAVLCKDMTLFSAAVGILTLDITAGSQVEETPHYGQVFR